MLDHPRTTMFSPCRRYRYTLWREWDMFNPRYVQFIGLNPSTADETLDDPTIRRCIDYAKRWGYGGVCMTNLFAYRATDPQGMRAAADPIGPDNDYWLLQIAQGAMAVVVAWGTHGYYRDRADQVLQLLDHRADILPLTCLGYTKEHYPRHPLYVKKTQEPVLWHP